MLNHLLQRLPNAEQLKQHPLILRFDGNIQHSPIWHLNRRSAAKGMAAGMFIAFLPLPFRTAPLIALCLLFKANFVIAIACTWLLNFVVMGPVFYFAFQLGVLLLGWQEKYSDFQWQISEMLNQLAWIWQPLMLGSVVLGLLAAVFSFYITQVVWYQRTMQRWNRRNR